MSRILIVVEGGNIQSIITTQNDTKVQVIDHDDLEQIYTLEDLEDYFNEDYPVNQLTDKEIDIAINAQFENYKTRLKEFNET